jgi:PAS domain S-box-containing protein
MPERIKILLLEDSSTDAELVYRLLLKENPDLEFNLVPDKETFLHALEHYAPDVILADNSIPRFNAKEALQLASERVPDIPFILLTGSVSEEYAANIIKLGADDYILKDRLIRLPAAIDTAIKQQRAEKDKREAQDDCKRSNERFQTLSMATKDAIWDWNLITDEMWWSESFYRLFGYDPQLPVPGPSEWTKRILPADRNKVMARLKGIASIGISSWEDEFRLKLNDGSYGHVLDRAYILKDEAGSPVRVVGALVNITEQKRLIREMEILSLIARETNNSVIVFDTKKWVVSWVNEAFIHCTGYTKQDLDGHNGWVMLSGSETDKDKFVFINLQIKANLPFCCDLLIYSKNGEKKWQSMSGQPLQGHGGEGGDYFVIGTDISERRRMEEERLVDKIERQREVTRMILQVQENERNELGRELHDNINQILAAVSLKLTFYLDEPNGNLEIIERCRDDLNLAIQETRNLSHHMVMPRFTEKKLKDELELLIENFSFRKRIQLHFDISNETIISSAIKETLYRIAQEQLTNIDKHAKAGKVEMRLNIICGSIAMDIQDNGEGFNVYQRGKGVGLTNILNRVESYNGIANIVSRPGKGCTLSLSIPLTC